METKDRETLKIGVLDGLSLDDMPTAEGFDFKNLSLPIEVKPLGLEISEGEALIDVFRDLDFLLADDAFVLEMRQRVRNDCVQAVWQACEVPMVLSSRVLAFEGGSTDKSMAVAFPQPVSSRSPRFVNTPYPFLTKALLKGDFPNFVPDGVNDMPYIKRSFGQRFPSVFERAVYSGFYTADEIEALRERGLRIFEVEGTRSVNSLWCCYSADRLDGRDMYGLRWFLDRPKTGVAFTEFLTALAYRGDRLVGEEIEKDESAWTSSVRSRDSLLRRYSELWGLESKKNSLANQADLLPCTAKSEIRGLASQFLRSRYPDWQRPW